MLFIYNCSNYPTAYISICQTIVRKAIFIKSFFTNSKPMEKIQLYSGIIDNIVETIVGTTYPSKLITSNFENYHKKLEEVEEILNTIHLNEIEEEIWECNKQFRNHLDTLNYVNSFFKNLLTWRQEVNTITEIISAVDSDLNSLYSVLYFYEYSTSSHSAIRKKNTTISIKLFQIKQQYKEICERFTERVKATKVQKELPASISCMYNFRLNPDYADTAAGYLNAAIDKGWFIIVDQKKQLLKVDILIALGYIFGCPIPEIAPDQNPLLQTTEALCSTAPVSEPAAIATNSLAAHLLHTQPSLLAERIKTVFNIEKGKSIRLLIKALEENQPALITVANRNFKAVYLALKETLGRDIGSYQSVKGYTYDPISAKPDYDAICQKLTHILTTLESGQIS